MENVQTEILQEHIDTATEEGKAARAAQTPVSFNPYHGQNVALTDAWINGWFGEEFDETEKVLARAYAEGALAYENDLTLDDNPHTGDDQSDKHTAWQDGWEDADEESDGEDDDGDDVCYECDHPLED